MTPSFADAAQVLEETFGTAWTHTAIRWDGQVPQDAPSGGANYVEFSIHEGPSINVSCGGLLARCTGIIRGKITTPAGEGTREGRDLADKFVTIYAGKKFGPVTCRMGTVRRIPAVMPATDEQFLVTIPFFYHAQ